MAEGTLTPERILEAAEEVLRRYGPAKATVVDVARALGVSHGSVYRHFPDKASLRDKVAELWLSRISAPLDVIAHQNSPAIPRLKAWLEALVAAKRAVALEDPELFATYVKLASEARTVVAAHVAELVGQIEHILRDGTSAIEVGAPNPPAAANAIFIATSRFHNPAYAASWSDLDIDEQFDWVWALLLNGLRPR